MLAKAIIYKDLKEYHLLAMMYTTIEKSKFAYEILNHNPFEGFKPPKLLKYDSATGYPNDHI